MDKSKVRFGLSEVHFGTFTVANDGTVTLGTPMAVPGAVNLTLDPETAESIFYADNKKYYAKNQDNGYTGTLEMAKFPDTFLKAYMNYRAMTGGGTGQYKNLKNADVYMMFQVEGDVQARKTIMYNISLGQISASHATTEDTIEPTTETLPITVIGDNTTGLVKATYEKGDSSYDTLFTNPPIPAASSESES